jgi:hypothetical protein
MKQRSNKKLNQIKEETLKLDFPFFLCVCPSNTRMSKVQMFQKYLRPLSDSCPRSAWTLASMHSKLETRPGAQHMSICVNWLLCSFHLRHRIPRNQKIFIGFYQHKRESKNRKRRELLWTTTIFAIVFLAFLMWVDLGGRKWGEFLVVFFIAFWRQEFKNAKSWSFLEF